MPFEIEFLPVGKGDNSGDAILLRYHDGAAWRVMVIDAGYEENGEQVVELVRRWFQTDVVDYVVSTHPDNDHLSGLRVVLRELRVRELWIHAPFNHADAILPLFKSRRWQPPNMQDALRRAYPIVQETIELAWAQKTQVFEPFQGGKIGPFTVLSPTKAMYEGLLPQFRNTPPPDQQLLQLLGHWLQGIGRRTAQTIRKVVREDWGTETLREGGTTTAENESSVVLYGDLGAGGILLTADAGLRGLQTAVDYAEARSVALRDALFLFQVPHHGSRNNISPSMLDRIIGPPLTLGRTRRPHCVISAGPEDKTHPRQVVVNALTRRGLKPSTTDASLYVCVGIDKRDGYQTAAHLTFQSAVEAYD